jgi:hypothetical protein
MSRADVDAIFTRVKAAASLQHLSAPQAEELRREVRTAWRSIKPYVTGQWPYSEAA